MSVQSRILKGGKEWRGGGVEGKGRKVGRRWEEVVIIRRRGDGVM